MGYVIRPKPGMMEAAIIPILQVKPQRHHEFKDTLQYCSASRAVWPRASVPAAQPGEGQSLPVTANSDSQHLSAPSF